MTKDSSGILPSFITTAILFSSLLIYVSSTILSATPPTVCIIGSGIGGSSVAHFLRKYSNSGLNDAQIGEIRIFERHGVVGGRMATITIGGETFEAGASILHPKNYHALDFSRLLNLTIKKPPSSTCGISLGIWNGQEFVFKTINSDSEHWIIQSLVSFANSMKMFFRYGLSLFSMNNFVKVSIFSSFYLCFWSISITHDNFFHEKFLCANQ